MPIGEPQLKDMKESKACYLLIELLISSLPNTTLPLSCGRFWRGPGFSQARDRADCQLERLVMLVSASCCLTLPRRIPPFNSPLTICRT